MDDHRHTHQCISARKPAHAPAHYLVPRADGCLCVTLLGRALAAVGVGLGLASGDLRASIVFGVLALEWRHPQADSTRRGTSWVWGVWLTIVLGIGLAAVLTGEGLVAALLAMAVIGGFTLLLVLPLAILLHNVSRFVLRVDETGTCSFVIGRRVRQTCALRGRAGRPRSGAGSRPAAGSSGCWPGPRSCCWRSFSPTRSAS